MGRTRNVWETGDLRVYLSAFVSRNAITKLAERDILNDYSLMPTKGLHVYRNTKTVYIPDQIHAHGAAGTKTKQLDFSPEL